MIVGNEGIDRDRRRFLGRMALAIGAAHVGMFGTAELKGASRQLAAIGRASEWLNSPRLTPESLAGKVVLVQFWTYTCINWLRTLPYVRAWAQKYRQKFVVIGVHTPEFAFEHNIDNVRRAVRQMGIEYPAVIDNDYSIWRAFNNRYWPALYFVDARGRIRDHHFGEGEYQRSESALQRLFAEAGVAGLRDGDAVSIDAQGIEAAADWANLKSPETYVGYDRHRTSLRVAVPTWIDVASIRCRRVWRSINGRLPASGRCGDRPPSLAVPADGSCTAFTHATFISSWVRHRKGPQYVSACRLTGSHRAPLMVWTSTRAATARLSSSGCISSSGSRDRSSIGCSRSSSSMLAWRRSRSRSADAASSQSLAVYHVGALTL